MAMNKRKLLAAGLLAVLLLSAYLVWFYVSKPTSFPTQDQLIKGINDTYPKAAADIIQDTVHVDERHVFVPFISKEDQYGVSYWVWQKRKWKVGTISTGGEPHLWRINKKDPSTYHFVWNMHPDNQLDSIQFYLIRDRGYHVSEGIENYSSRVQMEKKVLLQGKPYGILQMPDEWLSFMNPFIKVESAKQPSVFSNVFYPEHQLRFGWVSSDRTGKKGYPENTKSVSSYINGGVDSDFVWFLNEEEIE